MSPHDVVEAGKAVTGFMPPPGRLAYYTGLGALAAFGVVDWPVAVAIGVGVGIARGTRRSDGERAGQQSEKKEE